MQNTYQKYKNKSHFILEGNKYKDFSQIINKIKNNIRKVDVQKHKENIKTNILLDQLHNKINKINLKYKIKEYLNKQRELEYRKIFNNQYYNEIINLIELQNNHKDTRVN
ncbi:plasmid maintenance protein (plasmid) [Borreliella garinii]|uniref:plasmid maintenance protein n=1 Tax=Borreliella garinii TaxID=29519 RepID=UPI00292E230E|nr:plasmid maintenance protein [Borreliella garinii]WNZ72131.1 plasmid maintenance protein [Borreliella garinii]